MRGPRLSRIAAAAVALALLGSCAGCRPENPSVTHDAVGAGPAGQVSSGSQVTTRVLALRDPSRPTAVPGGATVAGRALPTTLWYPEASSGPLPLVVFSHGFGSAPDAYDELLSSWAAAGFLVAAPTFPLSSRDSPRITQDVLNQPADVSFVLTSVLTLNATPADPLAGRIDTAHVAVAGHSAGAITTIGLLSSCCVDHRVTAAVVLAGSTRDFGTRLAAPGVPTFFVHGLADDVLQIADDRAVYAATRAPAAFLTLTHGTHSAPFDDGKDPSFPTVRTTTTDFLRWSLAGDRTALSRLRADATAAGLAALTGDRLPR
jgi:dienelactone hydrolase